MTPLSEVIRRCEADYLRQYSATMLPSHRQALAALKRCRTAMAPRMRAVRHRFRAARAWRWLGNIVAEYCRR